MSARQRVVGIVAICVVLLAPVPAKSQTKRAPKSAAATDALTAYKEEVAKLAEKHKAAAKQVDADFVDDLTKLKTAVIARLEQARKDATKADDLDEAIRIRDTMHEIETTPIKAQASANVQSPRSDEKGRDLPERRRLEAEVERLKGLLAKKEASEAHPNVNVLSRIAGKWTASWSNGKQYEVLIEQNGSISEDGIMVSGAQENAANGASVLSQFPQFDAVHRYTVAGNVLLLEEWHPAATYPNSKPFLFGRASRRN